VLTEGQIDSLSVAEAYDGAVNAVSVPLGKNGFTWIPYCWDFLSRFRTLIVFGDYENDEITLLDEMRKRFRGKVKHVRPEDYKGCKDANDLLRKYGKQAVRDAVENAEVVRNPKIIRLADVKRPDMSKMGKVITHIPEVDRMLGGLYFGQLVLLTGERGLGKSTLGSQICVRAIDQGYNVFAYSGELPDWMFQDWVDRQCAGPGNVRTRVHESGFEEPLVDGDIENIIKDWYAEQFLLYDNNVIEGDEYTSLLQLIEESISQYDCRVVFIDNLMTAIDDDTASDFYRQQSAFCRKLTEIAHRFEVLVILVAHPRKRNGSMFNNDDISGSGNIANLADVVMRYTTPSEDNATGADRLLQITKNRINGRVHYNDHGIPLYFEAKSKRIAATQYGGDSSGIEFRLGWEAQLENEDGFLSLPEDIDIPFDSEVSV
jgi:archaellum biogenesis ATPase FlaH